MQELAALIPDAVRTPVLIPVLAVYIPSLLLVLYSFLTAQDVPFEPELDEEPDEGLTFVLTEKRAG